MGLGDSAQPLVIGRYSLFREIASGGMASVHLGRLMGPAGFARTVAIKRMHPEYAREPEFVAMFVDEARLASRVQHHNVVPTIDVVATGGELFLVMEYVRGESLARLLREAGLRDERVPPRIASAIVIGLLQGLHAAHEATSERGERLGLVHRDVSVQNVLVGVDGVARVLDFGIAKAVGRIHTTRGGQVKGKLAYMSPEQVRGAKVDRTTDVYAAGVVLWEALTGLRLFAGSTDAETLNRVLSASVRAPSDVVPDLPRALDAVVLRALERDPEMRFATAREMALALQTALEPAPASDVGEWVERLAAESLASRLEYVAEVESSSSRVPALNEVLIGGADQKDAVSTRPPPPDAIIASSPVRRRSRAALAALLVSAVAIAAVSTGLALRGRRIVPVANAAAEPPLAPSTDAVSSTIALPPLPSSSSAPPNVTSPRSTPPHRGRVAPAARPQCDPPWIIDGAGGKKWKPECR